VKQYIFIGAYLLAIVLANLVVASFGVNSVYVVAFILIGLDLTTRDFLHEYWKTGKWWKMGLLIGVGSLISWLLNKDAGMVALASCAAFGSAAILDTISYQILHKKDYLVKVNGSNLVSAFVDSFVFISIAFGISWEVILLQYVSKFAGGFIWSLILRKFRK
jgi:hypothetical protein